MKRTASKAGLRRSGAPVGVRSLAEIRKHERTYVPKRSAAVRLDGGVSAVDLARAKKELGTVSEKLRRDELKQAIEIAKRRFS